MNTEPTPREKIMQRLKAEAEHFFEWDTDSRDYVTYTSCMLFAEHIADQQTTALRARIAELENHISGVGKKVPDANDAAVPVLSRDYAALYDLLLAGREALGFADYKTLDKTLRDPVSIRRLGECWIMIGARGTSYAEVFPFMLKEGWDEKALFISTCEMTNLEWVCATPPAPLVPEGNNLPTVLDEYERQTKALPVQHEMPSQGCSTYNWRMMIIRELRAMLAAAPKPEVSK